MHLFLLDLYISVDTLAPIIDTLNPKKVIICNVNPIRDYKNDKLLKYLLSKEIKYINFVPLSKRNKLIYIFTKIVSLMPCGVQKKFQFFYNFVYHNYKFSSEKLIKKFLSIN